MATELCSSTSHLLCPTTPPKPPPPEAPIELLQFWTGHFLGVGLQVTQNASYLDQKAIFLTDSRHLRNDCSNSRLVRSVPWICRVSNMVHPFIPFEIPTI